LPRKRVNISDYPDGTIDFKYRGLSLPFSVFDKVRHVDKGTFVSNKWLGAVLRFATEEQQKKLTKRSKRTPSRPAQKPTPARKINPAAS
jgi:hypothetical protein